MRDRPHYLGCIFDLDGTLLETREDIAWAANEALRALGHPTLSVAQIVPFIGGGVRRLIASIFATDDPATVERALAVFRGYYQGHMVDRTHAYDGVDDLLRVLHGGGIPIAVLSNKLGGFVRDLVRHFGWSGLVRGCFGDGDIPAPKPDPRAFAPSLAVLGLEPASVLVVGDSPADVQGGRAAGCGTCGVTWGIGDPRPAAPDHLAGMPAEIVRIVLGP